MILAGKTDIGKIRTVNEDRSVNQEDVGGYSLAIVADGMGGHQAGDTASQIAIETIQQQLQHIHNRMSIDEIRFAVRKAIEFANETIFAFAAEREHYHGMGTTVVVTAATERQVVIGHIGDSRAYYIHNGSIRQLTEDHSLVNELVKSGQISREEASQHPRRNVLTRALGTEPGIEVDVMVMDWHAGDMLLLCSDGLSSLVGTDVLLEVAAGEGDLDEKVDLLVQSALNAGGDDNITVTLVWNVSKPTHSQSEER
jgi:serine/threonine protein phosphatase PrpC